MVYDILNRLIKTDNLRDKIIVFESGSVIAGGSVSGLNRSRISYYGGESGQEMLTVPLDIIVEIRHNEIVIFRGKKRVQKIYPRG
jgi:hypothetical protein